MGVGTLIYSNGLVGTQPISISPGGAVATFIGNPDVPQIKKTINLNNTTSSPYLLSYPSYQIWRVDATGVTRGSNSSASFTIAGSSVAMYNEGPSNNYGTAKGDFFARQTSQGDISTNRANCTGTLIDFIKGYSLYDKSNATVTIRHTTTDLADPITNFSTFGTEFDATQYTNTQDYTDGLYSSFTVVDNSSYYIVSKFENVGTSQNLMGLIRNSLTFGTGCTANVIIYLWNFNSSSWDTLSAYYMDAFSPNGTGGTTVSSTAGFPMGGSVSATNYVSGGICYFKIVTTSGDRTGNNSNTLNLGYVGLLSYTTFANA